MYKFPLSSFCGQKNKEKPEETMGGGGFTIAMSFRSVTGKK